MVPSEEHILYKRQFSSNGGPIDSGLCKASHGRPSPDPATTFPSAITTTMRMPLPKVSTLFVVSEASPTTV